MNSHTAFTVVLVLNALWFGAAFRYFGLTPVTAAKLLVKSPNRESPVFATLAAGLRFLGGMNFAFAAFACLLLASGSLFTQNAQLALFAAVFSLAHASQFAGNLPVAFGSDRRARSGEPLWPVLSGPMLFIFVVDFGLMVANAVIAVVLIRS